jgi:hypothetical protein
MLRELSSFRRAWLFSDELEATRRLFSLAKLRAKDADRIRSGYSQLHPLSLYFQDLNDQIQVRKRNPIPCVPRKDQHDDLLSLIMTAYVGLRASVHNHSPSWLLSNLTDSLNKRQPRFPDPVTDGGHSVLRSRGAFFLQASEQ